MLKEPIVVNGTICRADWVDGASVRCRDTLEGGEKRQEDWTPSGCSICAMFEASPCRDIFTDRCARSRGRALMLGTYCSSGYKIAVVISCVVFAGIANRCIGYEIVGGAIKGARVGHRSTAVCLLWEGDKQQSRTVGFLVQAPRSADASGYYYQL